MLRASRVPDLDGLGGIRGGCGGESLPIIEGWQGGFHVLVGGRSRGLEEPLVADFGVRDRASGESLTYLDLEQKVHPDHGGDWDEFSGLVARFRHDDPSLYTGGRVVVWARVTDDAGETQSDEVEATLR